MSGFSSITKHSHPNHSLTKPFVLTIVALVSLCLLHTTIIVLWISRTLDKHDFDLSKLGTASQLIAIAFQACTVGLLSLLSFAVQTIAADKFVKHREYASIACSF